MLHVIHYMILFAHVCSVSFSLNKQLQNTRFKYYSTWNTIRISKIETRRGGNNRVHRCNLILLECTVLYCTACTGEWNVSRGSLTVKCTILQYYTWLQDRIGRCTTGIPYVGRPGPRYSHFSSLPVSDSVDTTWQFPTFPRKAGWPDLGQVSGNRGSTYSAILL